MLTAANEETAEIERIAVDFDRDGYALMSQLIQPEELDVLREETAALVNGGFENKENPTDYMTAKNPQGAEELFRVQYIFNKAPKNSLLILLAQPFVLSVVQRLLGENFVCAAEALVFKKEGNGRAVSVHADCDPADPRLSPLVFNVDYYLDDSNEENGCLWAAPGTHKLNLPYKEIAAKGFDFPGLIPVPVKAGDVLLHNVRTVHGSHQSQGKALRRTIYYEFQDMDAMLKQNGPRPNFPMNDAFIRARFRLLLAAIDARSKAPYAQNETPFAYHAPERFAAQYGVTPPTADHPANLRPALGYNAYI